MSRLQATAVCGRAAPARTVHHRPVKTATAAARPDARQQMTMIARRAAAITRPATTTPIAAQGSAGAMGNAVSRKALA